MDAVNFKPRYIAELVDVAETVHDAVSEIQFVGWKVSRIRTRRARLRRPKVGSGNSTRSKYQQTFGHSTIFIVAVSDHLWNRQKSA